MMEDIICPSCGNPARQTETRYGLRAQCDDCNLWSWDGKPLVSREVHEARKRAHEAFDPIWQNAELAYSPQPDTEAGIKRVRKAMRNRAYMMLSSLTGIPEAECHMSTQCDLDKLRRIEAAAKLMSPVSVRAWYQREYGHGKPPPKTR